ncbi:MAG: hypothetical protein ACOC1O_01405 [bacterium]
MDVKMANQEFNTSISEETLKSIEENFEYDQLEEIEKTDDITKNFYNNISHYYKKVNKILKIIKDFSEQKNKKFETNFIAIHIKDGEILETNEKENFPEDLKRKIEEWYNSNHKTVLKESIYKFEYKNMIFLLKIFKFKDNKDAVIAGYMLNDSLSVRTFLMTLSEKQIEERYEKIMNLL